MRVRLSEVARAALWAAPLAILVGTIAAGYLLRLHYHRRLGAPNAPMYWFTRIDVTAWAIPAVAVLAASAWAVPWVLRWPRRRFLWAVAVLALVTRVALNMSRHGPDELALPFTGPEAPHEYLPSVSVFDADPVGYLRHFPELVATKLPIHAAGHPPGPTLILAAMNAVWLGGAWPETVMILLVGAATVYPVYLLARELAGELDARLAVVAWLFAPSVLLMSATSMDAVFAFAGTILAVMLLRVRAVASGLIAAASSFLSYALLAVPVWALAVLVLRYRDPRSLIRPVAVAAGVAVLCYGVLWLVTGYDPHAAYLATRHAYAVGVSRDRPQRFWFFGDIATFLLGLGIPGALLWARALERRDAAAVALTMVLLIAAGSGYAKAEVERIWLFLVPLAAVSIGPMMRDVRLRAVLLAMAAQAVVVEMFFGTTW